MNTYMGSSYYPDEWRLGGIRYKNIRQIDSPGARWVIIDEHADAIEGGEFRFLALRWPAHIWGDDLPGSRHAGTGVLSFADGHAATRKWVDPRTTAPEWGQRIYYLPANGSKDVLWLWLRSTTPDPEYTP